MGLLDSILSAVSGTQKAAGGDEGNQLLGVLSGFLAQSGGLQGLPTNFPRAARATHSRRGLAWVKISQFPAIKFRKPSVPIKFVRLQVEWEWIPI
jgi:hypothetical protein